MLIDVHQAGIDCFDCLTIIDNSYDDHFGTVKALDAVCETCEAYFVWDVFADVWKQI